MHDLTEQEPVRAVASEQPAIRRPTSRWRLLWVWLVLGSQSFGGGMATLFLIRRMAVEQEQWLSDAEFTSDWSLCFIAPGINLLAMTVLLGHRVAGVTGSLIALLGLLAPSVTITALMAALYRRIQELDMVQAALGGIIPATVGLGLVLGVRMVVPLLAKGRREGPASFGISVVLLVGSMLAALLWEPPIALVLFGAGLLGAMASWGRAARQGGRP